LLQTECCKQIMVASYWKTGERYVNPMLLVKFGLISFCIADCQTRQR
jgi:hypothetical protein